MTQLTSQFHRFNIPVAPGSEEGGWQPFHFFKGSSAMVSSISCHMSALNSQVMPHPPHRHMEEEILLMLDGEADLVFPGTQAGSPEQRHSIRAGELVYYPKQFAHSLQTTSHNAANYLMFKWWGDSSKSKRRLAFAKFNLAEAAARHRAEDKTFQTHPIFEGSTEYLRKLHCHLTELAPGCGYPSHHDPYDVAIVLLEGHIQVQGQSLEPKGVIYFPRGEPHDMFNKGEEMARYLVIEFHGDNRYFWLKHHYWKERLIEWLKRHPMLKQLVKTLLRRRSPSGVYRGPR